MNSQPGIQKVIALLRNRLTALGHWPDAAEVERAALRIHRCMGARSRWFHCGRHAVAMTEGADPIAALAALYHDTVYVQVDLGLPPAYEEILSRFAVRDGVGYRVADAPPGFVASLFGLEPGAADLDKEIGRLEKKKAAGAELIMTQPIFQTELLETVLRRIEHLALPVLVGVLPLVSYKNAEFLHNEVPGMQIPEEIRERMRKTPGGEAARKEGVKIVRDMLFAVRDRVQGAYLMPPLGRYELALEVLDGLKR
jgi:hypothetical protein